MKKFINLITWKYEKQKMVKYIKRQMTNSEKNTDKGLISPNISRELILISGGGGEQTTQ